jgi:hypothetical protein
MAKRLNREGNLGEGVWNEKETPQTIWSTRYEMRNLLNFKDEIYIKGENVKPDKK